MKNRYSLHDVEGLIQTYSKAIEAGNAALFIGSGISVGLGKDSWKSLLHDATRDLGVDLDKSGIPYPEVAQFWIDENKHNKRELTNKIREALECKTDEPSYKSSVYKQICHMDIRDIWTTNYDEIIEGAYHNLTDKVVKVIDKDDEILNLSGKEDVRIYKMHGSVSDAKSMIITSSEYFTYKRKRPFFNESLLAQLLHKTFLFIGFSFDDPNIINILQTLKDNLDQISGDDDDTLRPHYLILYSNVTDEEDKRIEQYKIRSLSNLGIKTFVVSPGGEKINKILSQIRKYTLRKNIVVAGSCRLGDSTWEELPNLSKEIGKRIVNTANEYNLHTCYGKGVGKDSIKGALEECAINLITDASDRIRIWPTYERDGISEKDKAIVDDQRSKMVRNAAACIFMGGSRGTHEEYLLAKKHEKFCIPIGVSGGSTKGEIWEDFLEYYDHMCRSNNVGDDKKVELLELIHEMNEATDIERIVTSLFHILDEHHDSQLDIDGFA